MCPVVLLALGLSFLLLLLELTAAVSVAFSPSKVEKLVEGMSTAVNFTITPDNSTHSGGRFYSLVSEHSNIADVVSNSTFYYDPVQSGSQQLDGSFELRANFLGYTNVYFKSRSSPKDKWTEHRKDSLPVSVVRKQLVITKVFTASVATLVSLNYINMGCALDLAVVKTVLKKPIAPIIGLGCQFVMMPLIAYGLAQLFFSSNNPELRLGLFTFGCSPGGGASNMWTVLLGGNLNLSITMTFISTLAALGMMPLWLFTLGRSLFIGVSTKIPYENIMYTLISMIVPVGIGLLLQRFAPRVAKFCRRILAPVSIAMILFIIVFGTYANLYMFKLFSWQVVLSATLNVWLGFLVAVVASKIFSLSTHDLIAIVVETGVQNTGIAIVLLGFSLVPPDSDIASVIPVAASVMTPFPLLIAYIIKKIHQCRSGKKEEMGNHLDEENEKVLPTPSSSNTISENYKFEQNGHI